MRVVLAVFALVILICSASAQADTLERVEYFEGTPLVRARYSVLEATPAMRHGVYVAYRISGLLDSMGRYDKGKREGPWLLYDSLGRARFREHFTAGERVERVVLRVLPTPISRNVALMTETDSLSATHVLLMTFQRHVQYPAMAREAGISGSATVQVICGEPERQGLRVGRSTHAYSAQAVLPNLTAEAVHAGLLERLCGEASEEVVVHFRFE